MYITPTHDLAKQVRRDLLARGLPVHYWREGPVPEDECPHMALVEFFREFGYVIRWGPCLECDQRRACAYRNVYISKRNESAPVLVLTSWHLRRPDLWALKATRCRDLVILDEDALGALTAPVTLTGERLQGFIDQLWAVRYLLSADISNEDGEVFAWLTRRLRKPEEGDEALLALTDIFRRAALDLLRACAGAGHGRWVPSQEVLVQDINAYDRGLLESEALFDRLLRCAYAEARRRTALPNILAELRELLLSPRPVHLSSGAVRWTHRANLPRDRHVLLLDATAEPEVVEGVLKRPVQVVETSPVRQRARIVQIMDRVGTRNAARKDLASEESWIRQLATAVARRHRDEGLLCITFKQDEESLQNLLDRVHGRAAVVHYGALRGLNAYSAYEVALILGRPMPNEAGLQLLAVAAFGQEALSADLTAPPLQWQISRHRIGPDLWTIRHQQYPDPQWAAVWRHVVTGELLQAVGRLRPLTNPATVYVATNEPLPGTLELVGAYAGEIFPSMALSGRRSDFAQRVQAYARTMQAIRSEGGDPTNAAVCNRLGLKPPNGLRYRPLATLIADQPPETASGGALS